MSKNTIFNIVYQFISQREIRTMKIIFYNLEIPCINNIIYENGKYSDEESKYIYNKYLKSHFNCLVKIYKIERIYS